MNIQVLIALVFLLWVLMMFVYYVCTPVKCELVRNGWILIFLSDNGLNI